MKTVVVLSRNEETDDLELNVVDIDGSLESLNKIVGGYIEMPTISTELASRKIDVVINEEGKLIDLKPTILARQIRDVIFGNVIFIGSGDYGESISLTTEQIDFVKSFLVNEAKLFNIKTGKELIIKSIV